MVLSLYYSYRVFQENNKKLPIILEMFQKEVLSKLDDNHINKLEKKLFSNYKNLSHLNIEI